MDSPFFIRRLVAEESPQNVYTIFVALLCLEWVGGNEREEGKDNKNVQCTEIFSFSTASHFLTVSQGEVALKT